MITKELFELIQAEFQAYRKVGPSLFIGNQLAGIMELWHIEMALLDASQGKISYENFIDTLEKRSPKIPNFSAFYSEICKYLNIQKEPLNCATNDQDTMKGQLPCSKVRLESCDIAVEFAMQYGYR